MGPVSTTVVVITFILILLVVWAIGIYNGLVKKRVATDNAWSQIDVQLNRRYDLIPNLIETVKGYASHEKETLEAVVEARGAAMGASKATGPGSELKRAGAENMLTGALKSLFALSESYPDLKANQSFLALQEELASTENKISFARQHFNDSVGTYVSSIQMFPANIIAGAFGFEAREFFEIEEETKSRPEVSF